MNPPSWFARAGSVPVSGPFAQMPSAIGQPFGHNGMPAQWPPYHQATLPNNSPSTPPTTPYPSTPWLRPPPLGTVLQPQNPTLPAQQTVSGVFGAASAATQQIQSEFALFLPISHVVDMLLLIYTDSLKEPYEATAQRSSTGTTATASNVFAQTPRHDKSLKGSTSGTLHILRSRNSSTATGLEVPYWLAGI